MSDESDVDVEPWEQPFLKIPEETENHLNQAAKNLKHLQKHFDLCLSYAEELLSSTKNIQGQSDYAHYEMVLNKLKRERNVDDGRIYKLEQIVKTTENELKNLREVNEGIQDEILQLSEDLERLSVEEEHLLKQRKEAVENMQSTWKAYIEAKNRYKKNLDCHVRLHDSDNSLKDKISTEVGSERQIFTFSFVEHDKTVLAVKLCMEGERWKMLETDPPISAADDAQTVLHKTNDIRGLLVRLRKESSKRS